MRFRLFGACVRPASPHPLVEEFKAWFICLVMSAWTARLFLCNALVVRARYLVESPEASTPMLAWCSSVVERSVAGGLKLFLMRVATSDRGCAEGLEYLGKHLGVI
jgi:hypothetical protein